MSMHAYPEHFMHVSHRALTRSGNSTAIQATAKTESTATFVTALWLNAAIFGGELLAFTLLRPLFQAVYEPRTYIPEDERKRSPRLPPQPWGWPLSIFRADYNAIKLQNGMDAYFFVRFLRMLLKMFVPIWVVSWAVLLPVTGVETGLGKKGLDRFTFGNIGVANESRYWAHVCCAWAFTIWTLWVIQSEMRHFVTARQQHLVDPAHSKLAQANTILITGIPTKFLTVKALTHVFSHLPGGVRKVWLNRDLKDLPDIYERHLQACSKLESAETDLISTAVKLNAKKDKGKGKEKEKVTSELKSRTTGTSGGADAGTTKNKGMKESEPRESGEPLTSESASATGENGNGDLESGPSVSRAEELVPRKNRPTHRLPAGFLPFSLPLIGKKVDSIDWAREEIRVTSHLLKRGRDVLERETDERARPRIGGVVGIYDLVQQRFDEGEGKNRNKSKVKIDDEEKNEKQSWFGWREWKEEKKQKKQAKKEEAKAQEIEEKAQEIESETYPALNSAFVLFNQQIAAHLAAQALTHHEAYRMSAKYVEVAPEDVIWGNLGLIPYERNVRTLISYAATGGLIILWSFPVAFIGVVSNVSNLCQTYSWLAWLCKLPPTVIGILEGVLPQALLALLMMLLPIVLRLLGRFEGIPRKTGLELSLMTRYFCFQVINSFLIVTISSGIIAALPGLVRDPASIPSLLASSLPQASNFFLSYIVLQGLSGTAAGFLQIVPFLLYYVKLFILGSTPRSVYKIKYTLRNVHWGTLFPSMTLLAVISIAYMVISPIINGLAVLTFFFYFQMYKYLFLYQLEQPVERDTGGLFFPLAIQHIFVGLYIQQICLCALFFLARSPGGTASAIPEAALMVVLIFFTAFFHLIINNSYGPLIHALPLSLADKSHTAPWNSSDAASVVIGDERPEGYGGDAGNRAVAENADKPARTSTSSVSSVGIESVSSRSQASITSELPDSLRRRGPGTGSGKQSVRRNSARSAHLEEPTDFYHPAGIDPQCVIWLPTDNLGLAKAEVDENRRVGIAASCAHASMDANGHVDIDGRPPRERNERNND
ncbi:hypothetical protein M0805_002099 [Coniferiporia weirii]|nr:hypothetical protein M0805_002099 [Coniferiporia weirii]